ncbi:hypothetical protein [Sporichthya sp.]|uniref:hypothetical protein n=1 Tax=Sporichthya sp. TaxID=65475 RepID=UPI00181667E1|nr:hypothetical protein [Sporichthya sp.]MBA3744651.1 hypothetical protein [Sporichthya sp.]
MTPTFVRPACPDDLLTAAGQGDLDAFGAFYDRTVALIFPLLQCSLGDTPRACAATERVYVWMWAAAPDFRARSQCAYALLLAAARREITEDLCLSSPRDGAGAGDLAPRRVS